MGMRPGRRNVLLALGVGALLAPTLSVGSSFAGTSSTTVVKSFHGNDGGGTTARISGDGNVVDYLSPDSPLAGQYEHIGVGDVGEGYVLCYTGPTGQVNNYDTGEAGTGFGPATVTGTSPTSINVNRQTTDGRLTLTQGITFDSKERAVRINMRVVNNTGSPVKNVVLRRQVDFDVDTGGTDGWADYKNWHAVTSRTTSFAWNDPSAAPPDKDAHGMQLRFINASPFISHNAYNTSAILDSSCGADSRLSSGPQFGDFGDTLSFNVGVIPSHQSKFATVEYSRF